jgi:hypothetical protein
LERKPESGPEFKPEFTPAVTTKTDATSDAAPGPAPDPHAQDPRQLTNPDQRERVAAPDFVVHDAALTIKPVEAAFARRLFALLPTPRAVKRFSNTYRILKASVPVARLPAFEGTEAAPGTFRLPMLLLALLIGLPREAAIALPALYRRVDGGGDPVAELLALQRLGFDEQAPAAEKARIAELQAQLKSIVTDATFPRAVELYREWMPRVARFSFEVGRAIRPGATTETSG